VGTRTAAWAGGTAIVVLAVIIGAAIAEPVAHAVDGFLRVAVDALEVIVIVVVTAVSLAVVARLGYFVVRLHRQHVLQLPVHCSPQPPLANREFELALSSEPSPRAAPDRSGTQRAREPDPRRPPRRPDRADPPGPQARRHGRCQAAGQRAAHPQRTVSGRTAPARRPATQAQHHPAAAGKGRAAPSRPGQARSPPRMTASSTRRAGTSPVTCARPPDAPLR
jgi:hypothetical protein